MKNPEVVIKRAYSQPDINDGYRVLVDRLWPRGVAKGDLAIDEWCKDISPNPELRKWFGHQVERFEEFSAQYKEELRASSAPRQLLSRARSYNKLTLVYAAKDPKINHATILKNYLETIDI